MPMDGLMDVFAEVLIGAYRWLITPWTWLSVLVVGLIVQYHIRLTRKLYYRKVQNVWTDTARIIFTSTLIGAILSIALPWIAPDLNAVVLMLIWGISLFSFLFKTRWMHAAYSILIVIILKELFEIYQWPIAQEPFATMIERLNATSSQSLWILLAIAWMAEAIAFRINAIHSSVPLFVLRNRSRVIGGYWFEAVFPVSLWISSSVGFVPLPLWVTRAQRMWSDSTDLIAKRAIPGLILLALFAVGMALQLEFAWTSSDFPLVHGLLSLIAAALLLVFYEWGQSRRERREAEAFPKYVHGKAGYKVLAVVPGSPADELGIQTGDIVHKVNGQIVRTRTAWHEAMSLNAAFCKLEVENAAGNLQLLQKALYSDRDHQLGFVFCPDGESKYYFKTKEANWLTIFGTSLSAVKPVVSPSMVVTADTFDQWPGMNTLALPSSDEMKYFEDRRNRSQENEPALPENESEMDRSSVDEIEIIEPIQEPIEPFEMPPTSTIEEVPGIENVPLVDELSMNETPEVVPALDRDLPKAPTRKTRKKANAESIQHLIAQIESAEPDVSAEPKVSAEALEAKVRKKRKKDESEQEDIPAEVPLDLNLTVKTRGRPRKKAVESNDVNSNEEINTQEPARPRGRPRAKGGGNSE